MSLARLLSASTVLVLASACQTTVNGGCPDDAECCGTEDADCGQGGSAVGGSGPGGTGGGGGPGGGGSGGVGGTAGNALAVDWADLGNEVAPAPADTILLTFSSEPLVCADPLADLPHCEVPITYRADIPLPIEHQYVGAVVDLESLIDVGYGPFFTVSIDEGDGLCSGGGGTLGGVLEVTAIDGSAITVNLTGTDGFDVELDGLRTFARCGGGGPVGAAALAMTDIELDALYPDDGGSTGQTGGGGEPPLGRLFVFVDASEAQDGLVCQDPYAYEQTCVEERKVVVVGLNPEHQAVGTYPMGEGGVAVSTSESGPNEDGSCWGGGSGGWNDGTVEVVAINDAAVELKIVGGPADGLTATAARCF